MGIGFEKLRRVVRSGFPLHERWRRIEDAHAGRGELLLEIAERWVLEQRPRGRARAQPLAFDARLRRDRQQHEVDPATRELIAELHDRLDRVGLDAGAVRTFFQAGAVEKCAAGDVVDIRSVEQPAVAAEIHLLVRGAQLADEERLDGGEQPLRDDGVPFERLFRTLQFLGVR